MKPVRSDNQRTESGGTEVLIIEDDVIQAQIDKLQATKKANA